ncbi:protein turtle homolog A [Aplochiton taeniatus]
MRPSRPSLPGVTLLTAVCLILAGRWTGAEVRSKAGGVAELECSLPPADGPAAAPLHVVEWVRQDVDIPVLIKFGVYAPRVHPDYEGRVSLVRNTSLRLKGLLLEDQGWYECRILLLDKPPDQFRNGTWTLLSVTASPIFTETPPPTMEALVGNPLALTCVASGNPPPTVTWSKDGGVIKGKQFSIEGGTLSLPSVGVEAGGLYSCTASNPEGNLTHMTKLKVKGPPVIVIPPKDSSLNMSQNALLRCQAVADPPNMTYVWQREGDNVHHIESLKSRVKIMVDGTLLITSLVPDDSGNYTCMPTNGLLTPPTASANLTVLHPAQALLMPPEVYLATAMRGLLDCPLRAQPALQRVEWTKDGHWLDLAKYPGWTLSPGGGLLMATVNDDAAGVYTCTPYNSYGTMGPSEATTVVLQDPPSFSVTPRGEYQQAVGGALWIPCQGDGDSSVTWSKVSRAQRGPSCKWVGAAAQRSPYSVTANNSLLLQPLSKDHQGHWECSAANRVGSAKASTLVHVLGTTPHAASSLSVSAGVRQANVSWEPGFDGGSSQKFSVWVKKMSVSDGADDADRPQDWFSLAVPPSSGARLQVTDLSPATVYQFSVLAHNAVGTGPFSQIAAVRTLDPPPRSSQLKPPTSLSANQGSAGVVLRWAPPASQNPPITGFVLQSRRGQGEWFDVDEGIGANRSEIIVPGLSKDYVYELRLLSRRGELLSEPSPSVNVSTVGMEMHPGTSRHTELVPEGRLWAGVLGGGAFLVLALLLLLGTACVVSHKRDQRRRKRMEEPPPAIFKCPNSMGGSAGGSPDSMLKKKLLQPHPSYPTTTSSSFTSSSQCSRDSPTSQYQDQRLQLLSIPRHPACYAQHRGHLARTVSTPIPSGLELISRGPDGRFIDGTYDSTAVDGGWTKRDLAVRVGGVQRSVSLRSERAQSREPPFVLSVELPPCEPLQPSPTGRVRAMAKQLSLHGHFFLDKEQESLYSECTGGSSYLQPEQGELPHVFPALTRPKEASSTASTLVLQMEHERERGNLSRCLQLAQEREELEKELRSYALERSAAGERRREEPGEEKRSRWEDSEYEEAIWKPQGSVPCQRRQPPADRGRDPPSFHLWGNRPPSSPSCLAPTQGLYSRTLPRSAPGWKTDPHNPTPGARLSRGRLADSVPKLSLEHQSPTQRQPGPHTGESAPLLADRDMLRDDTRAPTRQRNNNCGGSFSPLSFPLTDGCAEQPHLAISQALGPSLSAERSAAPTPSRAYDGDSPNMEMSVDEPELGSLETGPTTGTTTPMLHQRIAAHLSKQPPSAPREPLERCRRSPAAGPEVERRPVRARSTPRPLGAELQSTLSPERVEERQRSRSLDSRSQNQSQNQNSPPALESPKPPLALPPTPASPSRCQDPPTPPTGLRPPRRVPLAHHLPGGHPVG